MTKAELLLQKQEIDKQLAAIAAEEKIVKQRENIEKMNYLRQNKDFILSLFKHSRTSCSDTNPCNGYGSAEYGARCTKCHLIEILNDDWNNDFEVDINVDITRTNYD